MWLQNLVYQYKLKTSRSVRFVDPILLMGAFVNSLPQRAFCNKHSLTLEANIKCNNIHFEGKFFYPRLSISKQQKKTMYWRIELFGSVTLCQTDSMIDTKNIIILGHVYNNLTCYHMQGCPNLSSTSQFL